MDTLAAMTVFVAIVDEGSLTAASEALDRSLPAVVRSLSALENHLGVTLLQRTTRRRSLTPEGREYLERCRQIISDVEEAERAIVQNDSRLKGLVRVTAPVQFGQLHVAPVLSEFIKSHAEISSELLLLDRNVDLIEEGVDLAVRIGKLPDSDLIALPVGELQRVVCASPALLESVGEPANPGDLSKLPCIRQQILTRSGTWTFRDGFSSVRVNIGGRFSCNQIAAGVSACIQGVGFGQFLSYQVQNELRTGKLVRVLKSYEVKSIPVSLVYPGGRFTTARQRAAAQFLKEGLRGRVF